MARHTSRVRSVTVLAASAIALAHVVACSSDPADADAPSTALPEDTDDTAYMKASPETAGKYGVAYWGGSADADRTAITVVGYGANKRARVNLRYELDDDFVLRLSGPDVDARVRFGAPAADDDASEFSGVTEEARQLYEHIAEDVRHAATDDADGPSAAPALIAPSAIQPQRALVSGGSKKLVNCCWALIADCRKGSRQLLVDYLGAAQDRSENCSQEQRARNCWNTNGAINCETKAKWQARVGDAAACDLPGKREKLMANRKQCEKQRVDCNNGGSSQCGKSGDAPATGGGSNVPSQPTTPECVQSGNCV